MSRELQLGMNPSTASHRLVKDLLFDFICKAGNACWRCGLPMTRETFSIEHKEPWLHSADPVKLFFDLENVTYSHHSCNVKSGRRLAGPRTPHGTAARYRKGCRCDECKLAYSESKKKTYTVERRREKYARTGT